MPFKTSAAENCSVEEDGIIALTSFSHDPARRRQKGWKLRDTCHQLAVLDCGYRKDHLAAAERLVTLPKLCGKLGI